MRITEVETIDLSSADLELESDPGDDYRTLVFVRIHTDEGHVGLGETYARPSVDAAVVHRHLAPELLGEDPRRIERLWRDCYRPANVYGGHGGAEMRALSAVDVALWDLKATAAGVPLYELLGGRFRESLRTYNTCYERDYDFREEPVALAESLLEEGIDAMKIWPYDDLARETDGQHVRRADLAVGAGPLRAIRDAVGDEMDVAVEFHGLWNVQCAKQIAAHLDRYDPMWLEELVGIGDPGVYADVAAATSAPLTVSERLTNKYQYKQLLERVDVDVVMLDVEWLGGLTEARKVAALAESYQRPIAPHNCGGPVLHFANLHLGAAVPNLKILESVRDRYRGWHRDLVTTPAELEDGRLPVPEREGLGTELAPAVLEAPGAVRESSSV
jgi:L-alanine-DL-glutamate epimerase-like enolase superfamily enzyme